jgi:FHA domain/Trypsin
LKFNILYKVLISPILTILKFEQTIMPRFTQALKTGARIIGGADVPAFNLTYMSNDSKHRAGDYETIVIPYIELGRDRTCAVSFGDEFGTVSRRHAAIERQNKEYVIKHLGTNTTLVNGRPVQKQWFLTNGDIVQLSMEGPRLRFNVSPTGTGKMASTQKMKLLAQQLVRPYRTALLALASVLFLAVMAGAIIIKRQQNVIDIAEANINLLKNQIDSVKAIGARNREIDARMAAQRQQNIRKIGNSNGVSGTSASNLPSGTTPMPEQPQVTPPQINDGGIGMPETVKEQIYLIRVKEFKVTLPDGTEKQMKLRWTGTGFLLSDGKFVTARHVIQAWHFLEELESETGKLMGIANVVEQAGGKVKVTFEAISGKEQFEFNSDQFTMNDSKDKTIPLKDGAKLKVAEGNEQDWAYYNCTSSKSLIRYDRKVSQELKAGEEVHVLGYSYGGNLQQHNLKPLYSKSMVAQDGLTNGVINLTNRNFGHGNSGGPVFVKRGSEFIAVGIVSAGIGAEIGIIVPLSAMN